MCLEKLWLVGDELGATKVEGEGFILIKLLFLEKKHGAGLLLSPYRWREVFCDYHYGEVSFRPCCLLMHHCCMTAIVPGHWKWFSAYHDHPPPISAWRHHHHIIIIITTFYSTITIIPLSYSSQPLAWGIDYRYHRLSIL